MVLQFNNFTSKQIHDKHQVKNAYLDFWNNIKFKKGWENPNLTLTNQLEKLLDRAAEIVVRIRTALDSENSLIKLRMIDGSARELLWTLNEEDIQDPDKFVRSIVHATFKDANGYVEGLTENQIDEYIKQLNDNQAKNHILILPSGLIQDIKQSWATVEQKMKLLLNLDLFTTEPSTLTVNKNQINSLEEILKELDKINQHAENIIKSKSELPSSQIVDKMIDSVLVEDVTSKNEELNKSIQDPIENQIKEGKSTESSQLMEIVDPISSGIEGNIEKIVLDDSPNETQLIHPEIPEVRPMEFTSENSLVIDGAKETGQEHREIIPENVQELQQITPEINQELQHINPEINQELKQINPEINQESQQMILESNQEMIPENVQELQQITPETNQQIASENIQGSQENSNDKALLKIKIVAEGVDSLKKDIKSLHDCADKIESIEQLNELPDARKTVEGLQKKCLSYSEKLLKDLMSLDEIVNTPEARPLRKQQVQNIQQMMEDVDTLTSKLRGFLRHLQEKEEEKKKADEEIKKADEEIKKREESQEERKTQEKSNQKRKSLEMAQHKDLTEMWKKMKLKPKMDISESRDSYIISSYIPGMKKEDIEITMGKNKNTITISGIRLPTEQEIQTLKNNVSNKIQKDPFIHPAEDKDTLLLKAGVGRYGRFEETYELPHSTDVDRIEASYEGGVLRVVIPKIQYRRNPYMHHPQRGYHPNTFMNDRDFWW